MFDKRREVFDIVMKYCVEYLISRLKKNDFEKRNLGSKNKELFFWFTNFLDFPYESLMNWRSKVQ